MHAPFTLADSMLHLDGVGPIRWAPNMPAFWKKRDRAELVTGHVLSVFSYSLSWDFQERHPDGDELAVVLEGDIDFLVDEGDGENPLQVNRASACLIPAGAWHRVVVREPSTILFVTPVPTRTEHRTVGVEPVGVSSRQLRNRQLTRRAPSSPLLPTTVERRRPALPFDGTYLGCSLRRGS